MTITPLTSWRSRRGLPPREADGASRVEVLLKREAAGLLAYFQRRVRPAEDAADLLSETMVVAWRRSALLPLDDQEARMWLFGVARRVLSTHRRAQTRRDALASELRAELATQADAGRPETAREDPRIERLQALVCELPDLDREIVSLAVWDEFSLAEIASLLDMPAGTVRSRYSRARASLRARVEVVQEDPTRH